MNLISKFTEIYEDCVDYYKSLESEGFNVAEEINCNDNEWSNILAHGDNIQFMKNLLEGKNMADKLKLIYIDPPFFSKATYDAVIHLKPKDGQKTNPIKYFAYDDTWQHNMTEYLKMLCRRLYLMRELLADDGTIWLHLDWHVVHYAKIFMDAIFGEDNFVNEIIWHYKSGGSGKRHYARKHDTILVYSKTKKYYFAPAKEKSYNRGFKPYRFKGVKEYKDDLGWYTMVTMKDVWNVDMVGRTSSERTGYATQKPEALLERIIAGATEEGDLCADFFSGSGTLAAVCEKMGRKWICCDGSSLAVSSTIKRLYPKNAAVRVYEQDNQSYDTVAGKVDIDIKRDEITGSDKEVLKISLKKYIINRLPNKLDKKDLEVIKLVQDEDSLQFIEYWSVDFNFDGKVYRPSMIFSKEKGNIQTFCEKIIPVGQDNKICIKTVDVFGNYTYTTI